MVFPTDLRKLCRPSVFYFSISIIGLLLISIQNIMGDPNTLIIGSMSMYVPSVVMMLLLKFVYILFWTWVLDLMCKDGHSEISWIVVLFPIILTFITMLLLVHT